jgi:hypothetical protein
MQKIYDVENLIDDADQRGCRDTTVYVTKTLFIPICSTRAKLGVKLAIPEKFKEFETAIDIKENRDYDIDRSRLVSGISGMAIVAKSRFDLSNLVETSNATHRSGKGGSAYETRMLTIPYGAGRYNIGVQFLIPAKYTNYTVTIEIRPKKNWFESRYSDN